MLEGKQSLEDVISQLKTTEKVKELSKKNEKLSARAFDNCLEKIKEAEKDSSQLRIEEAKKKGGESYQKKASDIVNDQLENLGWPPSRNRLYPAEQLQILIKRLHPSSGTQVQRTLRGYLPGMMKFIREKTGKGQNQNNITRFMASFSNLRK